MRTGIVLLSERAPSSPMPVKVMPTAFLPAPVRTLQGTDNTFATKVAWQYALCSAPTRASDSHSLFCVDI